jgi:hypothetical protein
MSALTSVLKGTGKVLGTGAKVAAKGAGYLGRELLSTIFSSTYKPDAKKNRTAKNKNNKKQKASTELEALNIFNQNVVITNDILEKSLELQKQQNVILSHILGAIKSSRSLFGGDNDGGIDLPDLFDRKKFGQKKPSLTEEERKAEEKAAKEAEEKAAKEAEQKAAREAEEKVAKNAATKEAEEIAAKKAEVTAAKKAGKAVSKGVMERFVVWLEKKGAKALARRIASKLAGMAVGAVIPGLGWLMDVVLIASSVWDAWEAYQLWKEFENSADYKEDDAKKIEKQDETNTAPKDAEPVREEDKKEDGADKNVERLFASPIIEFEAKDISFTAKDMVINAEDIKSVTSAGTTTGASQTLGANLTGDNIPLTTPNGVPLPGNGEPTKNVPPEVLAQAEQIAATGNIQAVKDFMARNGHPMNGDWCGEFAASVVTAGGGTPPKNPQLASNWLNYGVHSDTAKEGYIAAKTTNRNTGAPLAPGQVGGHVMTVGKYDEKTGTYDIISGNSGGGQLKIKHMSEAQLKAQGYEFRRALTEEEQSVATNKDKPPVQPTKEAIVEPPKKPEKLPVKPEEPKKEAPKQTSNPAPPAPTPPPQPVSAPKQPAKSITPPTEHVSQRSDNRDKTTPTPPPSSQPSTGRTASNESSSAPSGSSNSFADLSMPSTQLLAAYLTHAA